MPPQRERVNLSFIPGRLRRLRDFGSEHRMQETNGSLQNAPICMRMITFLLDLREHEDVDKYLRENGGTLFDLILRAVKKFIEDFIEKAS